MNNEIITTISRAGFPIVCSVVLAKFCVKNYNKLQDKVMNRDNDSNK